MNFALMVASMTGADKPATPTNSDLLVLYNDLLGFTDKQLDEPTSDDRKKFMTNRGKIKNFNRDGLNESDQKAIGYMYTVSTRGANRQEDFYTKNGGVFSDGKKF